MTSKLISGVLLGVLVFIASMTVEAAEFTGGQSYFRKKIGSGLYRMILIVRKII